MELNAKTQSVLMTSALVCLMAWCDISRAAPPQSGSCPAGHQHMGHGVGHAAGMHTQGSGINAIAKLADAECSNCHGTYGVSTSDDTPNLAGQQFMYMCAWLDGCRKQGEQCEGHEDIAPKLTDQEIIDLSAFYADLPSDNW